MAIDPLLPFGDYRTCGIDDGYISLAVGWRRNTTDHHPGKIMDMEDRVLQLAQLLDAQRARLEVSDSVLAALIATHPHPGAVLREWQPIAARSWTGETLADLSGDRLRNRYRREALSDQIEKWTDVLRSITLLRLSPTRACSLDDIDP